MIEQRAQADSGGVGNEIVNARLGTLEEHLRCENAHDLEGIMQTFGQHARYDDEPWAEHHEGRTAVQSFYETQLRAAPDFRIDVRRRHVTEDNVILEVEISGTHRGLYRGLPGTGRRFRFPLCAVYAFDEQQKLSGERIYYDRLTALHQLGVMHEPSSLLGRLTTPLLHPLTMVNAVARMLFHR